ncbi:dipeptidase [Chondromyces crocatus]|uniref:Dipeptidase n=1 Tax=Chondromyces crocatus TaxID=52 RepID=A0A0K1EB12_CHOCO|nr:membrane dipeptidase [Chondromyces crocatus]AKT37877.1 dipeptidase [Chondromyces crocatus]
MSRRGTRAGAALVALLAVGVVSPGGGAAGEAEPPILVVDLHVDIPYQVHFKGRAPGLPVGHATPKTLKAGGYGGIILPIYIPDKARPTGPIIEDADAILATIEAIVRETPAFLPLDARQAVPGRVSTFLSIEGAGAFADDITQIDRFIDRGVRLISPAHASNTRLSAAATGKRVSHGLTELGKQFCERVYAHGALIDVSHLSDAAFADLVPIARAHGAPLVATHSNARAVAAHPRNLTDEQLREIARSGGVTGLNFHAFFVTGEREATLDDVVKQLDHMVKVAGLDHVAIGSDYDGGITVPSGLEDAAALPALARKLRARGMPREDVLKIFSLNALRVLGWRPAHSPTTSPATQVPSP